MRLMSWLDESSVTLKPGDLVKGINYGGSFMASMVEGVYISQVTGTWYLIATFIEKSGPKTDFKKKVYMQVGKPKKIKGKPSPALLAFAKKHPFWKEP